jgi:hypothetical protein
MSRYYKGAGVGTFWHKNDAMISGFTQPSGGTPPGVTAIKNHIVHQLISKSPYISLSRSYEVAENYAKYYGLSSPTPSSPAFVYELDILTSSGAVLIDPVQELASSLGAPFAHSFYQHNGAQDILLGLIDATLFGYVLKRHVRGPGKPTSLVPKITEELLALVRALRDAEVLASSAVLRTCLIDKHSVV